MKLKYQLWICWLFGIAATILGSIVSDSLTTWLGGFILGVVLVMLLDVNTW